LPIDQERMNSFQGVTRLAFFGFFASHIVFTLIVDGQIIFPQHWYPSILQDLLAFHISYFNDPLMKDPPLWFRSMIFMEYLIQLPFFFVACNYLTDVNKLAYPSWFRSACITYGAHTATTLVPILAALANNDAASPLERVCVTFVYLPYLIFPLWIWYIAAWDKEKIKAI
jgi:EXPERA (EXPanded EBP superfamily)